ncbi:MAG: FecR domain-containing protein [Cyclobacteriaceae bacterium]|nr:FecR domain-containing protein [Cyclobacteriaceae bacterium]
MDYSDFLAEDFVAHESFQNWYFQRDQNDIDFWDQWIKLHPHRRKHISEALLILDNFSESTQEVVNNQANSSWANLLDLLDENRPDVKSSMRSKEFYYLTRVAAFLILVAVSAIFWISLKSSQIVHRTDFGETKSITLPDNSVVTLNSNSKLTFPKSFVNQGIRSVWLEGEAFFSVVHTEIPQRFLVHTPDQVVVEVLGTEFNVKSRQNGTKIVLNSGKILLDLKNEGEKITMRPGELVSIPESNSSFQKSTVNTDLYTSWKCRVLVFDNTPLQEITDILEENYGLQVTVADASLLNLKVSGSVPSDNIKLLMEGLAESFGLTIIHEQNHVKISERVN